MSDAVSLIVVAIVVQLGSLATIVVTALLGRRKLREVHELVNGTATAQAARIEAQGALIADLRSVLAERRRDD